MMTRINKLSLRIFITLIAVFMLAAALCPMGAFADNSYEVRDAEFNISFTENGDAIVSEKWDVDFISGDFTRFYKDIYNPLNQHEYIDSIEVMEAAINDQPAERQYSTDRVDYHYYFEEQSDRFTIHWFRHSSNETVKYEIKYSIKNAVKLDNNGRAVFSYRLIGQNFPKIVGSVKTVIELPGQDEKTTVSLSEGSVAMDRNTAYSEALNVSGIYKVNADMPSDCFGTLVNVSSVVIPADVSRSADRGSLHFDLDELICPLIPIFIVVSIVITVLLLVPTRGKLKRQLKQDPDCFNNAASRIEAANIPFTWYALMGNYTTNTLGDRLSQIFYLELFDLVRKGAVEVREDSLGINKNIRLNSADGEFINLLYKSVDRTKLSDPDMIPFERISKDLSDGASYTTFSIRFTEWYGLYSRGMKNSQCYNELKRTGEL
ncbi:DUF2207 domain-containing protein, partial [Ruminococcus sp.]|uniref:DUF2207 domain-containing protein n=1 Tax=Ruminococcus sp. TaxID=41978 RepID=UPI002C229847